MRPKGTVLYCECPDCDRRAPMAVRYENGDIVTIKRVYGKKHILLIPAQIDKIRER